MTDTPATPPDGGPAWTERRCRDTLYERCARLCEFCCGPGPLELHHRVNRSQGGTWSPSNCIMLCRGCHHRVTVGPSWGRRTGLHVPPVDDPALTPVRVAGRRLWLCGDGTTRLEYDH